MFVSPREIAAMQHLRGCESRGAFPVVLEWAGSGTSAVADNQVFFLQTRVVRTSYRTGLKKEYLIGLMECLQNELKNLNNCRHACQVRVSLGHNGPDLTLSCEDKLDTHTPNLISLKKAWGQLSKLQKVYFSRQKKHKKQQSRDVFHAFDASDVCDPTPVVVLAVSLYPEHVLVMHYLQTRKFNRGLLNAGTFDKGTAHMLIRTCEGAPKSTAVYLALLDVVFLHFFSYDRNVEQAWTLTSTAKGSVDLHFDSGVTSQVDAALLKCRHKDDQVLLDIPNEFMRSVWFVNFICRLLGKNKLMLMDWTKLDLRLTKTFRVARMHYIKSCQ